MQNTKWWTATPAVLLAVAICGVVSSPAQAWSWPWQKKAATTASQPASASTATQATTPAPATKPMAQDSTPSAPAASVVAVNSSKAQSDKIFGIVENIDTTNRRLSLKTKSGKMESFTLAKSSMIFEHHKELALSSLKVGEHVSVHYASGTNEASKVYVLGDKKA